MRMLPAGLGLAAALALLALRLPLQSVSPLGVFWTLLFFILDPPFFVIQAIVPHGAHDLETSSWPRLEYPVAVASAVVWWLLVGAWISRRGSSANHQRAA